MEYFKKLNINEKSSKDDIKKAYFKLILKHHPDKGGNPQTFIKIKNTYDSLLISKFTSNITSKHSGTTQPFKENIKPFLFNYASLTKNINKCFNKISNYNFTSVTKSININKFFTNSVKKKYDLRTIFLGSVIGYITLRHILPKKELIYDNYNSLGDQLVGHTYVNCILFDQVQRWYDDSHLIYTTNSYFWRRVEIVDCNKKK